ncbi:hydroxyacylglutathione hydrolase [Oricola thermophila]|uniref:Hydroxyacylglutathione hydrolase n=1 Tax=Oricola thermophila TaxID=2742145 RepID=A0A6N1VK33_9HYPH|nr:hydroxyacylglutathione hydrolase [Oricola thermophila]QKV20135.1 hydroxyacylglutathione hydrolase [Oricola thermophila]
MTLQIEQFTCLSDNFGVLLHDPDTGRTASVDAPDAARISDVLKRKGWKLTDIMVTHHHADHTQGIAELKKEFGCRVAGPRGEADRIPAIDEALGEGDVFAFGAYDFTVIETPGHTAGHIVYHSPKAGVLLAGDTLFSLGCGRLFERGAAEMWGALKKLKVLPGETMLYCGHEYTLSNARFALTVDPDNEALRKRADEVEKLRENGAATLPVPLASEFATNPFLRPDDPAIRAHLGMEGASDEEVFAEIRRRKDSF